MIYGHTGWRALIVTGAIALISAPSVQGAGLIHTSTPIDDNLRIDGAHATLDSSNTTIIFEQVLKGTAGGTHPDSFGFGVLDGAAVLGYVFPTTLNSSDIGFDADEGLVALAITAHPDFDDTPLVDESGDGDFGNDGGLIHSHWVVLLTGDARVPTGLSVKALDPTDSNITLPSTHPGLPMFIDSPNFFVETVGDTLSVHVPVGAINNKTDFTFDAVTAFLEVHGDADPLLGVYVVYNVLSGDLSLPFSVVPEPSSAAIFVLGLIGFGGRLRRRRAVNA